jgi:hypothetical protein
MPYERVDIQGARLALARTDGFDSVCEPGKHVDVPTKQDWAILLHDIARTWDHMEPADRSGLLKKSGSTMVSHVHFALPNLQCSFVRKHTRVDSIVRKLINRVRGSRERRSFGTAVRLLAYGIPTATPVALIERGRPHFDGQLLMEPVGLMCDLDHFCLSGFRMCRPQPLRAIKSAVIAGVVTMFEALRRHGWFHRDMKASNIILFGPVDRPEEVRVGLLDLEGIRAWGGRSLSRWRRALVRLAASLEGYEAVTRTDRLRFLRHYLERTGSSRADWKAGYRALGAAADRYTARSRRRKGGKLDGYP